jgi:hypothetical protein
METYILEFQGSDRLLIDEQGSIYRLSLEKPNTEVHVCTKDYTYPETGWGELNNKTVKYFQYQLYLSDFNLVRKVELPTEKTIVFCSLELVDNADQHCEYQFAFVDSECIEWSFAILDEHRNRHFRDWQANVMQNQCLVDC